MAERVRAKYDIDRYRTLSNDRFASRQRFEQADANNEKARAAERKAQAALEAAERQLDIVDAQREQATADLDQAIADRDLARLNLSYTEIRSPIDGVVGNRSARAGAYTTVGARFWPSCRLTAFGSTPISERASSSGCAKVSLQRSSLMPCRAGRGVSWSRREPFSGHWCPVQCHSARECDWQLHQDRAARTRAYPAR
jgi:membrane fusion protein (multidrug efflux system)